MKKKWIYKQWKQHCKILKDKFYDKKEGYYDWKEKRNNIGGYIHEII